MIKIIGTQRIFMLAVMLGVNAFMAAAVYLYFIPQNVRIEGELRQVKADIVSKQNETERLQTEYRLIQEQRNHFEDLKATGFLSQQDRVTARERMEAIRAYSRVLLADYNILPVAVEESTYAALSNQVILNSAVNARIDALDDTDIYSFIYWLENGFPGQVMVNTVEIRRENEVNDVTLRQIGNGVPVVMVRGAVDFEWRTMSPREEAGLPPTEEGGF
jgi:hypothetical protein